MGLERVKVERVKKETMRKERTEDTCEDFTIASQGKD